MRVNTLSRTSLVLFIYRMGFPQGRNCTEYEGYTLRVFPLYILYVIYVPSSDIPVVAVFLGSRGCRQRERKRIGRPPRKRIAGRRENGSAESRRDRTRLGSGNETRYGERRRGWDRRSSSIVFFLRVSRTSGCAVGHFLPLIIYRCFCPRKRTPCAKKNARDPLRRLASRRIDPADGWFYRMAEHPLAAAWLASKTRLRRRRLLDSRMDLGGFS